MTNQDFDDAVEQYHRALAEFVKGNPNPQKEMFSRSEHVTLANPFGGAKRGRQEVVAELEHASSFYSDGEPVGFETIAKLVTPGLAFIFEIERYRARFGGHDVAPRSIRVTSVFQQEDGKWRVLHRQADPFVLAQSAESAAGR